MARVRTVKHRIGRYWVSVRANAAYTERVAAILDELRDVATWRREIGENRERLRDELEARLVLAGIDYEKITITKARE